MSRKFTTTEVDRFKFTAAESFNDSCNIWFYTATTGTDGQVIATYPTATSGVACGFYPSRSITNFRGEDVVPEYDGVLRLPLTQAVNIQDEIVVRNKRYTIDGLETGRTVQTLILILKDIL